jgi:spiro-SPASM protein
MNKMKNMAVINAVGLSSYAFMKLAGGDSSFSSAIRFSETLPEVERVVLLTDEKRDWSGEQIVREDWSAQSLLAAMAELSKEEFSHIFYFYGDCPFLDAGCAGRMYENHLKYFADYTFADGYPYGLTVEILSRNVIPSLKSLAGEGNDRIERGTLFELIKKDINSFDIETEIAPVDLRMLRVSLCADTGRNFEHITRVMAKGGKDAETICRILQDSPEILRTLPAFFNIQIVEGCPQNCSYCPYPSMRSAALGKQGEMSLGAFTRIVDEVERFCGDAVISISLWGEPAFHSGIYEIVAAVCGRPLLDLVIETSGIGWDKATLRRIEEEISSPPRWIISLDAWSKAIYEKVRGEGFEEAVAMAKLLRSHFPGRAFVQAVRMKENEEDMEQFYRQWNAEQGNVIVQKYDHFAGLLPDRRVTDLSPLKRFPCWHLKRDMAVLLDGSVLLCREDTRRVHVLGNLLEEPIDVLWQKGEEFYLRHVSEKYPDICKSCDEYYTFNF